MNRSQRWVTAGILCALAVLCVCMTGYVLEKARPENLQAFENRFLDQTLLGWKVKQGEGNVEINEPELIRLTWPQGTAAVVFETQAMPLEDCRRLLVNATIAGQQNANALSRWNYRVWMTLEMAGKEGSKNSSRIEVALESDKDRGRIYAAETSLTGPNAAEQYILQMVIEPLASTDGTLEAGWLEISRWEVYPQ